MISQKDILIKQLRTKPRVGAAASIEDVRNLFESFNLQADQVDELIAKYGELTREVLDLNNSFGGTARVAGFVNDIYKSLSDRFVEVAKKTSFYEQRNVELSKKLGITTTAGTELGKSIDLISNRLKLGADISRKYSIALESQFTGLGKKLTEVAARAGTQAEELLIANQVLSDQYGLSEEAAGAFLNYTLQTGKGVESTMVAMAGLASELEKSGVEAGTLQEMFEEISKVSATNSTIFGQYPTKLGLAAIAAKRLGTSFDEIASAARGALNIEESIGAEMEYQLLTGQKINKGNENLLNTLRQQYLTGADPTAMAKTYTSIFETQGDYIRNNVVAGEALAKTMGIGTDELYKQLRAYDARKAVLEEIKQPDVLALVEEGDLEGLQKKLDAGEIVGESQVKAIEDFLDANLTLEDSTMLLKRSLDTLNGTVAEFAEKLSPGITDVAARKKEALKGGENLKPALEYLGQYLIDNREGTELAGTGLFIKEILSSLFTATGVKNPFQDFILRPGQAPISFRKDDILIGGTDPFGQKQNANRMGGNVNIAAAVAQALESSNLNVTVKLDPLAVQTEAKFRSTRLNRTV